MKPRALLLAAALLCTPAPRAGAEEATFAHLAQLAQVRDGRLAAEHHTLQARRENVRIGESLFYPRVQFSSQARSRNQRLRSGVETGSDVVEHSLTAGMDVFNRKNAHNARAATSEAKAQEHRQRDVAQEVQLEVVTALLEMHAAGETLQLLKKRHAGMKRRLELTRAREKEGIAPRLEITIAEAEMETVKGDLALGTARLRKAQQTLFNLTGAAVGELPHLAANFRLPPLPAAEEIAKGALRGNPELKRAQELLQAHIHRSSAADAEHLPVLSISSEYSTTSAGADNAGIALQLRIPLYAGGALDAGSLLAAEQRRAAAAGIRDYRRRLHQSVFELHQDAAAIVQRERALKKQIAARRELLEKTRLAWLEGLRNAQDVINVEQTLFENERDLRNLYFQYLGILAQLQRLAGGINTAFLSQLDGYFEQEG